MRAIIQLAPFQTAQVESLGLKMWKHRFLARPESVEGDRANDCNLFGPLAPLYFEQRFRSCPELRDQNPEPMQCQDVHNDKKTGPTPDSDNSNNPKAVG